MKLYVVESLKIEGHSKRVSPRWCFKFVLERGKDAKLMMFYYTMHNCPGCREFSPMLKELYKECNVNEKQFEVVVFITDRNKELWDSYYAEMPFTAIPFKDKRIKEIAKEYSIKGLPVLLVFNNKTGELIESNGVDIVTTLGPVIIDKWIEDKC